MAKKAVDINPVFNHRKSVGLLDTAEELVDSLDNLSVCLKHIEEKYIEEDKEDLVKTKHGSLFSKLKENLDKARDLTDTLKREKWRLSRREMSVELRMGELEEYKLNLKRDMSDMNQTVDCLSMRIVQLENALCEAQETQEATEAEKQQLTEDLETSKKNIDELEEKLKKADAETKTLKFRRQDSVLRQEHEEMSSKMEILLLENASLKEMIRDKDDELDRLSEASAPSSASGTKKDSNPDSVSLGSLSSDGGTTVIKQTTEIAYV